MQPKQPNPFFKFSGMAIQMGVVIGLSAWGGRKLDAYYHHKTAVLTIILSLVGIAAALYLVIRDVINPKK